MQLSESPVTLSRLSSYDPQSLDQAIDLHFSSMGLPLSLPSSIVLIKPNLITARYGPLACTESVVITAVARWFLDKGAKVSVGDSPAFGSAAFALEKLGLTEQLQRLGVEVMEFTSSRQVQLPSGKKAGVATAALDCDLLVNLPRVKAHQQLVVTLAVKNLFGCLSGFQKPWWHMAHGGKEGCFGQLLVELLTVLPDTATLVDGVRAMQGTGPIHGEPVGLGILAGGLNPVGVDTTLLQVLGVDPLKSPLWLAANRANLPGAIIGDIRFSLFQPGDLQVDGFRVPEELSPIRFNPLHYAKNTVKRLVLGLQ